LLAIIALPFYSQLLLNKSINIGLKAIEYSLIPENIIRPTVICLLIIFIGYSGISLTLQNAITYNLIAFIVAYLISLILTKKIRVSSPKIFDNKKWVSLGLTFFLITITLTINSKADILMLGFFGHTDKVGIYNIAVKLSSFVALPLLIVNQIIAPYISEYFETKREQLASAIKKSIRIIFVIGSILFIVFILFGELALGYFGKEFQLGYYALLILSFGQVVNIFVGPVGNVLSMSKHEKIALKSMIVSTIINIILNLIMIPILNMEGAAIATFISLVYWNISQFILVKRKLKMNLSVI
jgi:O-antigen/teichoic acid export membrane protein